MTAAELVALRERLGWSKRETARRLDISVSRLADYEAGQTRGPQTRPAPIPRVVELALWALEHGAPLSFMRSRDDGGKSG
jgi:transcriptional regulator with XRE-family HTH domain